MKVNKLISMTQFILEIDWMTTKEFCDTYKVPLPTVLGGVDAFLQVDAIKHKMFVDYAKLLSKDINISLLKEKLGFSQIDSRGKFPMFGRGKYVITNDQNGFFLEPYDSVDGFRLSKLNDLVGLDLSYNDR